MGIIAIFYVGIVNENENNGSRAKMTTLTVEEINYFSHF